VVRIEIITFRVLLVEQRLNQRTGGEETAGFRKNVIGSKPATYECMRIIKLLNKIVGGGKA
jgi:hypothetical protein